MPEQYQCPIQGCDYTAGSPGSVKAHITRLTSDENHKGESGPDYTDEIRAVSLEDGGECAGSDPEPEPTAADGGSSSSAPEFPESDDGGNDPVPSSPPECPGCGSTDNESSDVYLDRHQERLESDHVRVLKQADHVCLECGGVFTDE